MAQNKENSVRNLMDAPKTIDTTIKFNIPRSSNLFDPKKHNYKCSCCGGGFTTQKNNFQKSNSPLYQANDGYLPWCKDCSDSYFALLTSLYTNDVHAIEHFCQVTDWVYEENPIIAAMESYSGHRDRSIISHYGARKNINTGGRKTFIDSLKFNYENKAETIIETPDDAEKALDYKLTPKMIKFWGSGYDEKIYPTLQGYYDELLKLCEQKPDVKKQKMMKNLCLLEYQMQVNIQAGKDIGTLSNSYKAMFEAAELKVENADTSNDSFGKWVMEIEKYSPAEYYKDKNKYHDFFGIVEYIERFMFRPLKNLIFGTKEKEQEYWINDEDDIKGGD